MAEPKGASIPEEVISLWIVIKPRTGVDETYYRIAGPVNYPFNGYICFTDAETGDQIVWNWEEIESYRITSAFPGESGNVDDVP